MEQETYYIGEFAERAAVTVRTVRYYDQIGLLAPARYTGAGQRLYTTEELATLQQILALKLLGFSQWVNKYFTPEQRETMEELNRASYSEEARARMEQWQSDQPWTEEDQRRVDEQYAQLARGLEDAVRAGKAPGSEEVQELAAFFLDLINQFTRGDAAVEAGLKQWWTNHDALPAEQRPVGLPWGAEEGALLDEAVRIHREREGSGSERTA